MTPRSFVLTSTVTGVALGDIDLHFVWQAWRLRHWAGSGDALGRGWSAVTPRSFVWQALGDIRGHFVWRG